MPILSKNQEQWHIDVSQMSANLAMTRIHRIINLCWQLRQPMTVRAECRFVLQPHRPSPFARYNSPPFPLPRQKAIALL